MSDYEKNPTPEDYIEVDNEGRIIGTMRVDLESLVLNVGLGKNLYPGKADPAVHYFSAGQIINRPENPARVEGSAVVDIPNPSYVWFRGDRYLCTDEFAEFHIDRDGGVQEQVTIESFPYLNKVVMI